LWYRARQPYYKIWPQIIDKFITTKLDISTEHIKFPHKIFTLLLPEIDNPLLTFSVNGVKSTIRTITISNGSGLIDKDKRGLLLMISYYPVDYDTSIECSTPGTFGLAKEFEDGKNIEDCLINAPISETDLLFNQHHFFTEECVDAIFRLVISTLLITTSSNKLVEFDVLSKDLSKYRQLDNEDPKKKEYETKARKKGKTGWHIGHGRNDRFLHFPKNQTYTQNCQSLGGGLIHQHIRGAHWHTYYCGKGRTEMKLVWLDNMVVRPDLPLKPIVDNKMR
jgi:hypothetical protein